MTYETGKSVRSAPVLVQFYAFDYDESRLSYVLQYALRWRVDMLEPAGDGNDQDLATFYDSVWRGAKVEVFGHGFDIDATNLLSANSIAGIAYYEGFRFPPFLPAGSHELKLDLQGVSLDPARLSAIYDSPATGDDRALIPAIFAGDDRIELGGDNLLSGYGGNDTILGGAGRDLLRGGTGDDRVTAGAGNDRLFLDRGSDTLDGGSGIDQIVALGWKGVSIDLTVSGTQWTGRGH